MKTCKTCKQTKPLTAFHKHPAYAHKDGRNVQCAECVNRRYRELKASGHVPKKRSKPSPLRGTEREPLDVRLWGKVAKTEGCWIWTGAKRHWGYGVIMVKNRLEQAHRIAWELTNGPIPEGKCLDHICKNPPCVRPDHLRVVTYRENFVDYSDSPHGKNSRKTHCTVCKTPYDDHNTALYKNPRTGRVGRMCLTCYPHYWKHAIIPRNPPPRSRKRL